MKKQLFYLLVAFSLPWIMSNEALAHDFVVNGIYYTVTSSEDHTVSVSYRGNRYANYTNRYSGAVSIPEMVTYNDVDYDVTGIGIRAFWGCSNLTSVTLPESIITIAEAAFSGCTQLSSIEIPNSVLSIDADAFSGCTGLKSISIGTGLNSFATSALSRCTNLSSIAVDSENPNYDSRGNCNAIIKTANNTLIKGCNSSIIPSDVAAIGNSAFENCTGLIDVELPIGLISIGDNAFYGCTGITSIEIPNSVKTIGYNTFYGCINLVSVTINSNDIASRDYTASNNIVTIFGKQVTNYKLGSSITAIGSYAFSGCTGITSSDIPSGLTTIGGSAFRNCTGVTSMELPISVTSIGSYAFAGCTNLTSISFPSSLTSIGEKVVDGCTGITTAYINCKNVSSWFKGLTSLENVTLGEGVSTIGEYAFSGCSGLSSITMGKNITTIGHLAFSGCTALTSIIIPKSVTKIVGREDIATSTHAFYGCTGLKSIEVEDGNTVYDSRDNCNAIIKTAYNTLVVGCSNTIIPAGVKYIESDAFSGCTDLTSIEIPNSVTSIGSYAFWNCSDLENVVIGENVKSIYSGAFADCTSLNSVYCYGKRLLSIDSNVFEGSDIGNVTLYVPQVYISQYQAVEPWKNFKEIKEIPGLDYRDDQTLELTQFPTITYGDEYALPEKTNEGLPLTWSVEDETVAAVSSGKLITRKAGITKVTATQDGNDDFNPFSKEFTLTIDKAALTITANDATKDVGDVNPQFTLSYDGFKYDDDENSFITKPTIMTTATQDSPAGLYEIIVSGAESDNYEITYINGCLTIGWAFSKQYTNLSPISQGVVIADVNHDGKMEQLVKNPQVYERHYPAGTWRLENSQYRKLMMVKDGIDEDVSECEDYRIYRKEGRYYYGMPYEISSGNGLLPNRTPSWTDRFLNNYSDQWEERNYDDIAYAYYEISSQDELNYYIGSTSPCQLYIKSSEYLNRKTYKTFGVDFYNRNGIWSLFSAYVFKDNEIYVRKGESPSDVTENIILYGNESISSGNIFVKRDGHIYLMFTPSTDDPYLSFRKAPEIVEKINGTDIPTKYYFKIESQEELNYLVGTVRNVNWRISKYSDTEPYEGAIDYVEGVLYKRFTPKSSLVKNYTGFYWADMDGKIVSEKITGIDDNIDFSSYNVDDLNNDGIPDFVYAPFKSYWAGFWSVYLSQGNTSYSKQTFEAARIKDLTTKRNGAIIDINHDGLKDLVYADGAEFECYIQDKNGTFMQQHVLLITDEEELEAALFKQDQDDQSGTFSVRGGGAISSGWGMFVQAKQNDFLWPDDDSGEDESNGVKKQRRKSIVGPTSGTSGASSVYEVIDMNNDGFPDLLNTSGGVSYLSLADGRYYTAALNGTAAVADLDGNGLKDIVIFDKGNNRVLLEMCQEDGSFNETKLLDNGSISAIYCQDLNADGKIDIMLQVPTSNYTIIVFYKNNGNGTFKKTERSLDYKGAYDFLSQPLDLNNSGIPSIVALRPDQVKQLPNQYPHVKIIDWDENFKLTENFVVMDGDSLCYDFNNENYGHVRSPIYDFDGDGLLDIPAYTKTGKWKIDYRSTLYTPTHIANTKPSRMTAPNALIDPLRGLMKIDWQEGSDAQSASGDLRYEVKVGTTDGANDMLQNDAGRSSTFLVNIGSWPLGDYYISMRAVDPNGMRGEWSPATMVTHHTPTANFFLDKHYMATSDTLVVSMSGNFDYVFDAKPDGTVIKQEDGKAYIMFANSGKKTVTAKINGGNNVTDELTVQPYKYLKGGSSLVSETEAIYIDADLDGKTERFNSKIQVFEDGEYKDLETLFNSDLYRNGEMTLVADYNMDGLPDVYGKMEKSGTSDEGWIVNLGDLDFEVVNDSIMARDKVNRTADPWDCERVDLDNDGFMDYVIPRGKLIVFHGLGNNQFEEVNFPTSPAYNIRQKSVRWVDLDGDGLLDCAALLGMQYTRGQYNSDVSDLTLFLYRNKGNMNFEIADSLFIREANESVGSYEENNLMEVTDFNHDAYPDIVYWASSKSGSWLHSETRFLTPQTLILGNPKMKLEEGTEINLTPLNCDYDNDGNFEFAYNDSIAFKRGDQYEMYLNDTNHYYIGSALSPQSRIMQDINNDGVIENVQPCGVKQFSSGMGDYLPAIYSSFVYENTAPTAPTSVFVNQTDSTIVVSWSGASDKETPLSMLRYNLSVKEKGATDENSYIISPMNGTSDIAKTMDLNNHQYRYATRYPIPFERFKAGKTYEIQVQTIDVWMEHSPFSQKVEFKPAAKALISMPEKGGVNIPVAFTYSDNTEATPTVNAGDGVVNGKTITWSTAGLKTVTVTSGAIRNIRQIEILETPVLDMDVPTKMLAGSRIAVNVPECFNGTTSITGLTGSNGLTVELQRGNETATVIAPNRDGLYQLTASYEDEVFGKMTKTFDINVVGASFKPELKLVTVANGKNKMNWDSQMSLPDADLFNGKVNIYRETSVSDSYELIGQADLSVGEFTDLDSRPDVKSDSYMMTLGTIYDTESRPSNVHTTMHLMANRGMGNNINLRWTPYVGADIAQYVIMAGPAPESLSEVAYVSGHTVSYTHERSSDAVTYYSVVYRLRSEVANAKEMRAPAIGTPEGESNVISSAEAYDVKMVTSIEIRSTEEDMILNENQQYLHLSAVVTPATATITTVEWSILEGEEYASIASNGIVNMIPTTTGGFVVVQARAIDGSGVIETAEIPVEPVGDELLMGDANGDGEVNVSDIVEIVNSILANPSDKFVEAAADMNGDGEVNVTDIVLVVNIIMSANNARPFGATATETTANDRLLLQTNSDHSLSLCLENEGGYVASQFDITLTDGQELEGVTINSERNNGHVVSYAKTGTDSYRVVVYSLDNQSYNDHSGELLNIAVAGSGSVEVSDIIFVTQNAQERRFAPLYATTTGIRVVGQPDNMQSGDCYDLSGRKLQSSPVNKGIYIINGKKQIIK